MGIKNVEELTEDETAHEPSTERETDQEQRDRKDKQLDEVRRARQERLGHVPASTEEDAPEEDAEPKSQPKRKSSAGKKST